MALVEDDEPVGKRRRSKVVAYYHIVWTTKGRQAWLSQEIERRVYRLIESLGSESDFNVAAVGGMPDHVHVIICAPGKYSPSALARLLKGPTSALVNDIRPEFSDLFRWQEGYGCFTLSRTHVNRAIAYVLNQKQHHAHPTELWPEWEQTDEAMPENT